MASNSSRAPRGEGGVSSLQSDDVARRDGDGIGSMEVQAPIVETSWDPYDVWLTRVKQPREQSVRVRPQARAEDEQPSTPDLSETARLRTLTITR